MYFAPISSLNLQPVVSVRGVDRAEDVELDAVLLQQLHAAGYFVEGRPAAGVLAVRVVQFARAIQADPDQEVVLAKEAAPLRVEQRPVRLDGVLEPKPGPLQLPLQLDRTAEEVEPHESGLPALPGDGHLRAHLRLRELLDIGTEDIVLHAELAAGVEAGLLEEEAIIAAQVTCRARGLREQMEVEWRRHQTSSPASSSGPSAYRSVHQADNALYRLDDTEDDELENEELLHGRLCPLSWRRIPLRTVPHSVPSLPQRRLIKPQRAFCPRTRSARI